MNTESSAPARALSAALHRAWRDPLVYFFAIGGAIFGVHTLFHGSRDEILITPEIRQQLAADYALLRGHEPDDTQLQTLVERYVGDEILFHEALKQGMHASDPKIKQRLVEKMRFLLGGSVEEPGDDALMDFYADHYELYYTEPQYSFVHVFFEQKPADPDAVITALRAGRKVQGDGFWLGDALHAYDESVVRHQLGAPFVEALREAPRNAWSGPVRSLRGWHFLRVQGVAEPKLMRFSDIRDQVRQDWIAQRHSEAVLRQLDAMKRQYDVRIEQ